MQLRRLALAMVCAGLALTLSGCLGAVRSPVLPLPVRLAAPSGFTLYRVTPSTSGLEAHCVVQMVDASVLAIRGDTVLLSNVRTVTETPGNPACTGADSLQLVVSLDPQVQAQELVVDGKRSRTFALIMLPFATLLGIGLFVLLVAFSDGGT